MFYKNEMRPAAASASASFTPRTSRAQQDAMMYNTGTSEAEEFNAFQANSARDDMKKRAPQHPNQKRGNDNKAKALIIAVAAGVAVLLLIAVIVGIALLGGGDVTYENNTYIAYADGDGNYHVAVNGKVLETDFEGEVEVIPSADRSFAYVLDTGAEGIDVYTLKGKKLESVTLSPATDVLACAELVPGVVYKDGDSCYLYTEETDERITKDIGAANFLISADASTVVYTEPVDNNAGEIQLYIYQNGSPVKSKTGAVPVAISTEGDYVYGTVKDTNGSNKLWVITTEDNVPVQINDSTGFVSVIDMNVDGDELLFSTFDGTDAYTLIYRHKKTTTVKLAKGVLAPAAVDPTIAIYDSFGDIYLTAVNTSGEGSSTATYYLSRQFKINKITSYAGKFDPDGKYFYYINKDQTLIQLDLTDDNYPKDDIDDDVVDFVITEKGNIYSLNEDNELRFYDVSSGNKIRISDIATNISLYSYANEVYFAESDDEDGITIYTSKEGSKKIEAELDSAELTGIPYFSDTHNKKCYAYYYDADEGWMIFYASNGRSFNLISSDCQAINGVEIPDMIG